MSLIQDEFDAIRPQRAGSSIKDDDSDNHTGGRTALTTKDINEINYLYQQIDDLVRIQGYLGRNKRMGNGYDDLLGMNANLGHPKDLKWIKSEVLLDSFINVFQEGFFNVFHQGLESTIENRIKELKKLYNVSYESIDARQKTTHTSTLEADTFNPTSSGKVLNSMINGLEDSNHGYITAASISPQLTAINIKDMILSVIEEQKNKIDNPEVEVPF